MPRITDSDYGSNLNNSNEPRGNDNRQGKQVKAASVLTLCFQAHPSVKQS
jgi:hypothetical protein